IAKRNEGLLETLREEEPEVAIVGAAHAFAIKREMPDIDFTLFLTHSAVTYLSLPIMGYWPLLYGSRPDRVVWHPSGLP
ncbi:MAG TPA: hypothetical protein VFX30_05825, partial [bacterium]|nr:hypothetical protein [bacterium]